MVQKAASITTYRHRFFVNGRVMLNEFTTDLERREREHQVRWPTGRIQQVGEPTTHEEAWDWEREQRGIKSTSTD